MKRRYGNVFSLRLLPEGRWLVVFHKPEVVKEIFAGDPAAFHAGKGNAILGPVMGEHSLLLVDGATHKRARKLLMPAFNGHALRGYQEVVTGLAKTEVGTWRAGEEFRSLDRMNALTLEVILQVVFGVTDEQRLAPPPPPPPRKKWGGGGGGKTKKNTHTKNPQPHKKKKKKMFKKKKKIVKKKKM
jgi:cytochrome P450